MFQLSSNNIHDNINNGDNKQGCTSCSGCRLIITRQHKQRGQQARLFKLFQLSSNNIHDNINNGDNLQSCLSCSGCRPLLYGLSSIIYALSRKYHKRADARRRGGRHQYLHLITPLLLLAIQNAKNIMKGVEPYLCDGHLPSLCCCGVSAGVLGSVATRENVTK